MTKPNDSQAFDKAVEAGRKAYRQDHKSQPAEQTQGIPAEWHDCKVAERQILELQQQRDELQQRNHDLLDTLRFAEKKVQRALYWTATGRDFVLEAMRAAIAAAEERGK